MRIVFYCNHTYYGGLNNTGGTRTLIRSAAALRSLGHKVDVVARKDRYTWEPHPPARKRLSSHTDVVIPASISDLRTLLHEKCPYQIVYWARGWERWQMPDDHILGTVRKLLKRGGRLFCNSGWLSARFAQFGIPSSLCYSGLDTDEMYPEGQRDAKLTVGCLRPAAGRHTTLHKTKKWRACYELAGLLGRDARMIAYGANPKAAPHWLDEYVREPSTTAKRRLYNRCHVWFSPSILEGFHNPPAEAALCGCLLVVRDIDTGGTYDYATEDTAYRYATVEDAAAHIRCADYNRARKCRQRLLEIGDRITNMRHMAALLEEGL